MTDLHTHILPGMDDGAPDVETSLAMLRCEKQQGVDAVALTPHFYRIRENVSDFLQRRAEAWNLLSDSVDGEEVPALILGAEVAWVPGMAEWPELDELCYTDTRLLLVELPLTPWDDDLFRQLYSLSGRRGVIPMIAHLDRYFGWQKRSRIRELLNLGFPFQVSSTAVLQPTLRKRAFDLLRGSEALLISDCHNLDSRAPNMGDAIAVMERRLGQFETDRIALFTDEVLID